MFALGGIKPIHFPMFHLKLQSILFVTHIGHKEQDTSVLASKTPNLTTPTRSTPPTFRPKQKKQSKTMNIWIPSPNYTFSHFTHAIALEVHQVPRPRHWFPGLLHCEGFLREFVTPIVKCSRGSEVVSFFTMPVAWWTNGVAAARGGFDMVWWWCQA